MTEEQGNTQPGRILIVEDDQFLRDLYVELLTSEGYDVDQAADGEEALNKMMTGGYDLVLLDIMLPKKDAIQILAALKKAPAKSPNKKIVFLTNMGQDSIIQSGFEYGVVGYLIKSSLTPDQLLASVKKHLSIA